LTQRVYNHRASAKLRSHKECSGLTTKEVSSLFLSLFESVLKINPFRLFTKKSYDSAKTAVAKPRAVGRYQMRLIFGAGLQEKS